MIRTFVDIFCKCGNWLHCGINISATRARRIAKAAGWRPSASHGDLCPACVARRTPAAAPPLLADERPRLRAETERQAALGDATPPEGWGVEGWSV